MKAGVLLVLGSSIILLGPGPVAAQNLPVGPPFRVNTTEYGYQGLPHGPDVANDADGNFVIVWEDKYYPGFGAFGRRFGSNGAPLGAQFQVNVGSAYYVQSAVSMDPTGDFVVVWMEDYTNILARRFDATGVALGAPFTVFSDYATSPRNPKVAHDPGGNFLVVWGHFEDKDISGQRFDSNGTPVGGEFAVNSTLTGYPGGSGINEDDDAIEITGNSAGSFMVTWNHDLDDAFGTVAILGRVFDSTGTPTSLDLQVNTSGPGSRNRYPGIAADGAGNFIVVWASQSDDTIRGRRFDGTGTPLGGAFQANVTPEGYGVPKVSADTAGNLAVVWSDGYSILGRQLDAANVPLGGEFVIDTPASYSPYGYAYFDDTLPDVASSAAGEFVVTWKSRGTFTYGASSNDEIFAQRFAPSPCTPAPSLGCRQPFVSGKGIFRIRDQVNNKFDDLGWQWVKGQATAVGDFGDPLTTTSYALCVYDASGSPQPRHDGRATAGGTCNGKPCWAQLTGDRFFYFDRKTSLEGVETIKLKPGADGVARIAVKFRGKRVEPPALPLTPPVTVQLQASNGQCWSAAYDTFITQNGDGRFRAKDGP
jgi:hypothetical protein